MLWWWKIPPTCSTFPEWPTEAGFSLLEKHRSVSEECSSILLWNPKHQPAPNMVKSSFLLKICQADFFNRILISWLFLINTCWMMAPVVWSSRALSLMVALGPVIQGSSVVPQGLGMQMPSNAVDISWASLTFLIWLLELITQVFTRMLQDRLWGSHPTWLPSRYCSFRWPDLVQGWAGSLGWAVSAETSCLWGTGAHCSSTCS